MNRLFTVLAFALLPSVFQVAAAEPPATAPSVLFNGWGLTPAGTHSKINDLPLKMAFSPDRSTIAAVCAGLHPALAIIDVKQQKPTQIIPLERAFNGVAFSADGSTIFVSGGNSDSFYRFALNGDRFSLDQRARLATEPP